jgi:hypothetical protein
MRSKQTLATLVLFIASLGLVNSASADVISNRAGARCVATGADKLTVRTDGESENNNYKTVTAICPAPRPMSPVTKKLSGSIFVIDRHSTENVCCYVASKNPGGAFKKGTTVCSSGNKSTYQILTLPELTDNYSWSSFYIRCTVPTKTSYGASRIQMYRAIQK